MARIPTKFKSVMTAWVKDFVSLLSDDDKEYLRDESFLMLGAYEEKFVELKEIAVNTPDYNIEITKLVKMSNQRWDWNTLQSEIEYDALIDYVETLINIELGYE